MRIYIELQTAATARKPASGASCDLTHQVIAFAKKQSGFGYVEYMVSMLGVLFLLFAPLPGQGGDTVVDYVMNAIRAFGQNSSLLLSLP